MERARSLRRGESLLESAVWCAIAAYFATYRHTGLYASQGLESLLLEIARSLPAGSLPSSKRPVPRQCATATRRVLHVLTRALAFGGHTRAVERWVRNDASSVSSLVATCQTDPLPPWLAQAIANTGGGYETLALPSRNLLRRAARLRALARERADVVVLHAHPYDVVPLLAFGVEGGPPVILFDHSDATFWLGARTADRAAEMREIGRRHSL